MNNIISSFDSKNCCGCGACINACPTNALSFGKDVFGFIRPNIDEKYCISCEKCIRVCPYQANNEVTSATESFPKQVYAAVNRNAEIVAKSSSGGIFYSVARTILAKQGVVFGASMDDSFKVRHISVESIDELSKILRSKYVQSSLGDSYARVKSILREGRSVLFSGTPCQIAGLKSYLLNRDYENLLTVEVVCHGVPSQDFFDDYRNFLESKVGPLKAYTFRYKEKSENGMKWFSSYESSKKKVVFNWPEDSYNYFYMKSLIYRDSCYECKFAKRNRNADLTLCDYWHWKGYHAGDFNASASVSGVIASTSKGLEILNESSLNLNLVASDFEYLSLHNSCLVKPCGEKKDRLQILEKWKKDGYAVLDAEFKRKHRKQILKYRVMRLIPDCVFSFLYGMKNGR